MAQSAAVPEEYADCQVGWKESVPSGRPNCLRRSARIAGLAVRERRKRAQRFGNQKAAVSNEQVASPAGSVSAPLALVSGAFQSPSEHVLLGVFVRVA
jgi:hypothetical protein